MSPDFSPENAPNREWDRQRESADKSGSQPINKQLEAAIWKTLEQAARDGRFEPSERSPLGVMIEVARRHSHVRTVTDLQLTSDLVSALGKYALPAPVFHGAIDRVSPEIASALLADPMASEHLNKAWLLARSAAGLTEE